MKFIHALHNIYGEITDKYHIMHIYKMFIL
jgi:hypothetical protein